MARSRAYTDSLLERLQDPEEAAAYLDAALEEGDKAVFLLALQDVAEARSGGIKGLAEQAGLSQEGLCLALSEQGNPSLENLTKLLHAIGLRLTIEVERTSSKVA